MAWVVAEVGVCRTKLYYGNRDHNNIIRPHMSDYTVSRACLSSARIVYRSDTCWTPKEAQAKTPRTLRDLILRFYALCANR